jgi:predicted naringenin-chalcone synthase
MSAQPHILAIGTAVPPHDVHAAFRSFARETLPETRDRRLFDRMAARAAIDRRLSVLAPAPAGGASVDTGGFYTRGRFPATAARMAMYERHATDLAVQAARRLDIARERDRITHLVVASCTGFMAPGLDLRVADRLGLSPSVERTLVGFMGCAAAIPALKLAWHAVRSQPQARVLVIALELCTLHLQETPDLETMLTFLLFGDGCAAALVAAEPAGIALDGFQATVVPETQDLITWRIGDQGFDMRLSGRVPAAIARALEDDRARSNSTGLLRGIRPREVAHWAVHAGGRTVLDAVEQGCDLPPDALATSRAVLREHGNMSSATVMFVLERMLRQADAGARGAGVAMAFGPGLSAETCRFRLAA